MPEQSTFLGFAAAQPEVVTDANPRPYLNLANPLEVTGGDQVLPLSGVNPVTRQINIQAIDETINAGNQWDGRRVWLVSHGFNGWHDGFIYGDDSKNDNPFLSLPQQIKQSHPNDIVLAVDWRQASSVQIPGLKFETSENDAVGLANSMNYFAATWIGPVAEKVAEQLTAWGVNPGSLNLIGHSLGAHLSSEIAYQVKSKNPNAQKVATITALDPASDYNPPNWPMTVWPFVSLVPPDIFNRYRNGYVYSRTGVGDVHPPALKDVADYSRAYLGRTSIAGSVETSVQADEAFLVDFGPGAQANPSQHLNVAFTFRNLINSTRPNLARNLLELNDDRIHSEFQQNTFIASDIFQRQAFEGVLLADSSNTIQGFYAKRADADGFYIYGTDQTDKVSMSFSPALIGSNLPRINDSPIDTRLAFGNNIYYLGAGSDTLKAEGGNDVIYGDFPESDSLQTPQAGVTYNDTINAGAGDDSIFGGFGSDKLDGSFGDDLIFGDDSISLGGGDDRLSGGDGSDALFGDTGNDRLFGGNGNDFLAGGDGDDILTGSDGPSRSEVDKLIGNAGADTFILNRSYRGNDTADYAEIVDLNASQSDKLRLSGSRENYSYQQQGDDTYIRYHDTPQPLDVILLADLSKSFRSELNTVKQLMPALVEKLQASYQDIQLGVSSFTDAMGDWYYSSIEHSRYTELKKIGKDQYGYDQYIQVERTRTTKTSALNPVIGYIGGQHSDLTHDLPAPLEQINRLEIDQPEREGTFTYQDAEAGYSRIDKFVNRFDDLDAPEAQLDALLQVASQPGLRSNATKIAILTTDSPFHQAGDGRSETIRTQRPYYWQGDYASVAQLRTALTAANIVPIFAVTKSVQATYSDLVEQLGRGAVVTLTANPAKLMNAITDAINDPGDLVSIVRNTRAETVRAQSRYVA